MNDTPNDSIEISIQKCIHTIRGMQVMLDRDLAKIYGVETKVLNQAVKRNIQRFPESFCFQLYENEISILRSQFVTSSSRHGGRRYLPFAFTEQGVAMLSTVLKSKTAIQVSILIMNAFVAMRKYIVNNQRLLLRIDQMEFRLSAHDEKFEKIFKALETDYIPQQGIFFEGQVFDAYEFAAKLIKSAKKTLRVIDNYVDESVLRLLSKRRNRVNAIIYTKSISKILQQDVIKHNNQYPSITIKIMDKSHDRFLIIDDKTIYHLGASFKDLGKKWFAFSLLEIDITKILEKV